MIESARGRVAVLYTLLFAAIVLAVASGVYWLIRNNAYMRLDQTLETTLDIASLAVRHEIAEHQSQGKQTGEAALREVLETMYQTSFPQEQIVVRDGTRLVAYKRNLGRQQTDLRTVSLKAGKGRANVRDLRIAAKQVYVPQSKTAYTVLVSTWRGDVNNDLASVVRALSITIPSALVLALLGGYLLAKRTLAPLRNMASTVDAITSKNLERRVEVVNRKDEVGQLAIRFNNLLERLQDAFVQQRQFMADASHELRTPIAAALTASQVTLGGASRTEKEYREALTIVEEQMLRLRRIVGDMFLLAQADAHALQYRWEIVYLDEIVAEACRAIRFLAESKNLRLSVSKLSEMPCAGDSGLLRQALLILLDNACKYTSAGGSIRIDVEITSETYLVRVADTGIGIPESAQPHIFQRFYRVDKSRSRAIADGGGAGLGLPIARWIAEVHGGEITLESSDSSGSVFALHLPRPPVPRTRVEAVPEEQPSSALHGS
ncbi:MAG TPA: ATP-binding protein [Bryobacteraceae bacterium]|nr:ATP-binding protein [Bryobacteraceae bacterium]